MRTDVRLSLVNFSTTSPSPSCPVKRMKCQRSVFNRGGNVPEPDTLFSSPPTVSRVVEKGRNVPDNNKDLALELSIAEM